MSRKSYIVFLLGVSCAVFFSMIAFAAENDPVTVSSILQTADVPLSEEQTDAIAALRPDGKLKERLAVVYNLFSGDQLKTLSSTSGITAEASRDEGKPLQAEDIRNLIEVIVLEKERVPLTEEQLTEIGPVVTVELQREQVLEKCTPNQRSKLESYNMFLDDGRLQ